MVGRVMRYNQNGPVSQAHFSDVWADAQRARANAKILRTFFFAGLLAGVRRTLARTVDYVLAKCDADRTRHNRLDASSPAFQSPKADFDQ
jgi:hypothetical protein